MTEKEKNAAAVANMLREMEGIRIDPDDPVMRAKMRVPAGPKEAQENAELRLAQRKQGGENGSDQ